MSADIYEFPKAGQVGGDRRGAGAADAASAASRHARKALTPEQAVSYAYRWTWRHAWRLQRGGDIGAGYRLLTRACMAGLRQLLGPTAAAAYLMTLAHEAAGPANENAHTPGPDVA